MRLVILVAMFVCAAPALAPAHGVDCNNDTQPLEIKSGCCGSGDYRALQFNEVRPDGDGFDIFLDGKWRQAIGHMVSGEKGWLIAQPTGAACWGIWYRRGKRDGDNEQWIDHDGNTEDYSFYCLERPAEM